MDERHELFGATFVRDGEKARSNIIKHGVAFEQAAEAFFDPFFRVIEAGRRGEARGAVIGYDVSGRLLLVVHVATDGAFIRIISARKTTRTERKIYDS